jgi:endonuclease-3
MPQTTHKQRQLTQLLSALKNRYGAAVPAGRPLLEEFVYAVCREGTTRDKADRAYRNLTERFFDWNEIRVSSQREVEEALADLPDPEVRAQRLISLLQEVFETTFGFDLEPLQRKGIKQAVRQLARYQGASDYAVGWLTREGLGGHAVPVDAPSLRVLRRLGLLDAGLDDPEVLRSLLEQLIPRARAAQFGDLVSAVADEFCLEDEPRCPSCPLCGECVTGQEAAREAGAGARCHRPKPR